MNWLNINKKKIKTKKKYIKKIYKIKKNDKIKATLHNNISNYNLFIYRTSKQVKYVLIFYQLYPNNFFN